MSYRERRSYGSGHPPLPSLLLLHPRNATVFTGQRIDVSGHLSERFSLGELSISYVAKQGIYVVVSLAHGVVLSTKFRMMISALKSLLLFSMIAHAGVSYSSCFQASACA